MVHGSSPHVVGGKATPWWEADYLHYVEAAIWLAGCDLRCLQCLPEFERVLVKVSGKPMLIRIGELFNRLIKRKKNYHYFKPKEKLEVLSFNPITFKVERVLLPVLLKRGTYRGFRIYNN